MKNSFKLALLSALVAASGVASAAYDGSREDRMQSALDNYHHSRQSRDVRSSNSSDPRNPSPGPAARAEDSIKHGASRAGHAIKNGTLAVGHAIGTGARKTGAAIERAGDKVTGKTAPAQ